MKNIIFSLILILVMSVPCFAELNFSEANVSFGIVTRPNKKTITVHVTNDSNTPFMGSISTDMQSITLSESSIVLLPQESKLIKITFDSSETDPGDHNGKISINSTLGSVSESLPIFVTVIQGKDDPVLSVDQDKIELGEVERGKFPVARLFISNIGSGTLKIKITAPQWLYTEEEVVIAAGQKRPLFMQLASRGMLPEQYKENLILKSDKDETKIPVTVKILPAADDPILTYTPTVLNFGTVRKGRKARAKLTINNIGKTAANVEMKYPQFISDGIEDLKELTKKRDLLIVAETKNLPKGVTRDKIKAVSKFGILEIPIIITVK